MRKKGNFKKGTKSKREGAYNIPNEAEIRKHKAELVKFMKHLDEDGFIVKKMTLSQKMSLIRGAIREKWMYAPNKLAYLNMNTVPDLDPNTRRRFKVRCESCEDWFTKSQVAVDHIIGEHSLKSLEDFENFVESILYVGFAGLQVLCHDCHDLKSAMERYGLTEEEVVTFKKVTAWEKKVKSAADQKSFLISKGYSAKDVTNKEKRRETALKYFKDN